MKKYLFHADTYDFQYYVVIGKDFEKITKFIALKLNDDEFSYHFKDSRGACFYRFNFIPVLWLPKVPKTAREYGTFSHEIFHLVAYILNRWAGLKLELEISDEAYCHLIGKITTDILNKIK